MPLPVTDQPWPPPQVGETYQLYNEWWAWYSGQQAALTRVYNGTPPARPSQYRGGIVGAVSRMFWGSPPTPGQPDHRLHVPVAGDIASTSADLLFGEPATLTVDNESTQDRLDSYDLQPQLLEAAELAAALGGVYLRAGYDTEVADRPQLDAFPPDSAVPEFRSRHLTAVTLHHIVAEDRNTVWRHLERHEPGTVAHGLYQGNQDRLGRPIPLTERPETEPFADQVGADGRMPTGADRLAVTYVPNMRPMRLIRGTPLGRSDYAGVEPVMDQLDQAWSSWMRDLRLGKARLVVPQVMLDNHGPGQGASFDPDREVYQGLSMLPNTADQASSITQVQFAIRVAEHEQTVNNLFNQAVRGAGYSVQTFGEYGDGGMQTATEVAARERRTQHTRSRKIGYWTAGLERIVPVLLSIDQSIFGARVTPQQPTVEFPDVASPEPETQARTLQMLDAAKVISTQTAVHMLHPDWSEDEVSAEVEQIQQSQGPDPADMMRQLAGQQPNNDEDGDTT